MKKTFKTILATIAVSATLVACSGSSTLLSTSEQLNPTNISETGGFHITSDKVISAETADQNVDAVRADIFVDPHCPYCSTFEQETADFIEEVIVNEKADVYFHPVAFLDHHSKDAYSTRAVNSLVEVAEHDPDSFLDYYVAVFTNQPGLNTAYQGMTDDDLAALAESVGVDPAVAGNFVKLRYIDWVKEYTEGQIARQDFFSENPLSTPTVLVGGKANGTQVEGATNVDFQAYGGYLVALQDVLK